MSDLPTDGTLPPARERVCELAFILTARLPITFVPLYHSHRAIYCLLMWELTRSHRHRCGPARPLVSTLTSLKSHSVLTTTLPFTHRPVRAFNLYP
jgi:hypothetical protein